jgi:hypothetical protein
VFEYLFTRINDFKKQDWATLQAASFVPVFDDSSSDSGATGEGRVTHASVHQVFIHENPETALTKKSAALEEKAAVPAASGAGNQQRGKGKGKNRRSNANTAQRDEPRKDNNSGGGTGGGLHISPREIYDNLLDFVNFGSRANFFLRSCGVGEVPSVEQLAQSFINHHKRYTHHTHALAHAHAHAPPHTHTHTHHRTRTHSSSSLVSVAC